MNRMLRWSLLVALLAIVPSTSRAQSQMGSPFGSSADYQPRVPVSAFSRPAAWFDPSRLHVSTTFMMGSGWSGGSGGGNSALQVTRLSYQFSKPAWMEVSVGNAWGGNTNSGSNLFLEGLRFGFRPSANSFLSIEYQNVRSPLQLNRDPYGYMGLNRDPYGSWGW
jgi:hypothetical protein